MAVYVLLRRKHKMAMSQPYYLLVLRRLCAGFYRSLCYKSAVYLGLGTKSLISNCLVEAMFVLLKREVRNKCIFYFGRSSDFLVQSVDLVYGKW